MTSTEAVVIITLLIVIYSVAVLALLVLRDIRRALHNGWVIGPYPQHAGQSANQQITPKDPAS